MTDQTEKILREILQNSADEAEIDRAVKLARKAITPLKTQNRQAKQGRVR